MKWTNHKLRFEIYRRHMHKSFELCCVLSCFADFSSARPLTARRVSTTTGAGPTWGSFFIFSSGFLFYFVRRQLKRKVWKGKYLTCPLGTAAGLVTTGSSSLAGVGHLQKKTFNVLYETMGYHFSHFQVIYIPDQKRSCSKPGWDSTGWPRCNKSPEMEELGLVPGHHPHYHPDYHHNTAGNLRWKWVS